MKLMNKIRSQGIPIWVSIYALITFLMGTIFGLSALFNPSNAVNYVAGADALAASWAGRNLGIGLGTGVAVFMRSRAALTIVFIGALFREIGDLISVIPTGQTGMIVVEVFLALDVIALILCIGSQRKQ